MSLPTIQASVLQTKNNDDRDYLFTIYDEYFKLQAELGDEKFFPQLNNEQHAFLAYNYLYGQVTNGGFIQLIQNGYGSYIFESPCIETLHSRWLKKMAKLLQQAQIIYNDKKNILEQEIDLEWFSQLYEEITDFEPLDEEFYKIMDEETTILKEYIHNNLSSFVQLI